MAVTMTDDQAAPDRGLAQEIIGDMAGMLNDTRHTMLMAGCLLGGLTLGISMEAALAPAPLGTGVGRVLGAILLGALIVSWLRSVGLLALAGRPILGIVNNQRWRAGAPLDPRARWLHLPSIDATPQESHDQGSVGADLVLRHDRAVPGLDNARHLHKLRGFQPRGDSPSLRQRHTQTTAAGPWAGQNRARHSGTV
jgi:hypothetical protein